MRLSMVTLYLLASAGDDSAAWALAYSRCVSTACATVRAGSIHFGGAL